MLNINGKELRNLEEQVQKNKEDIAAHYNIDRVLADFGIRIIGQVAAADNLPDPSTFEGDYGDAYAVGESDPYSFYIWTRADVDAGHPNDYWFDIGPLAIVGPQGPQGEKGDRGDRGPVGTQIYSFTTLPTLPNPGFREGDLVIYKDGYIYRATQYDYWLNTGVSIKGPIGMTGATGATGAQGPQGPQGQKGDTGDPGAFIRINGILTTTDQLPTPASLNDPSLAYLVGSSNDLWIQVKNDGTGEYYWNNIGPLNVATFVTVGGEFQNTWDADTKLAAPTSTARYERVPLILRNTFGTGPEDLTYAYTGQGPAGANEIPRRNAESQLLNNVALNESNNEYACVNLGYANQNYMAIPTVPSTYIVGVGRNKTQLQIPIQTTSSAASPTIQADVNMVPRYVDVSADTTPIGSGTLACRYPSKDHHAANKGYVDANIPKGSATSIASGATVENAIRLTDFGQTFLHGKSVTLTFTANGGQQSLTADNHIVIIYLIGQLYKILVLSLEAFGVDGFNGTLQSHITVHNGSSQYTTQMIKLPTKFD